MNSKDQGLTVGELTITIGILIIAGLIWSNLTKTQSQKQSLSQSSVSTILIKQTISVSPKSQSTKSLTN